MSDTTIYVLIVLGVAVFVAVGLAIDSRAPRVATGFFYAFSTLCFVAALLVAFGDLGERASVPFFRLKAVGGALICGLYFLHSARRIQSRRSHSNESKASDDETKA